MLQITNFHARACDKPTCVRRRQNSNVAKAFLALSIVISGGACNSGAQNAQQTCAEVEQLRTTRLEGVRVRMKEIQTQIDLERRQATPEIRSTQKMMDLQADIEGIENRYKHGMQDCKR